MIATLPQNVLKNIVNLSCKKYSLKKSEVSKSMNLKIK